MESDTLPGQVRVGGRTGCSRPRCSPLPRGPHSTLRRQYHRHSASFVQQGRSLPVHQFKGNHVVAALDSDIVQSPLAHPIGHRSSNHAIFERDEELHRIFSFRLGTNRLPSDRGFGILKVPVDDCRQTKCRRIITDGERFISYWRSGVGGVFWRRRRVLRGADINGNREDIRNRRDGVGPRLMIPERLPRGAMPQCGRRTAGRASRLGYTGNCWIGWAIDHWKPSPLR